MPSDRAKFEIELKTTAQLTDAEQSAASFAAAKTAGETVAPPRNEPGLSVPELKLPELPVIPLDPRRPILDSRQEQPPAAPASAPQIAAAPKPTASQTAPATEPQPVNQNSTPTEAPVPGAAVALARQALDQARAAQDNLTRQKETHQDLQDLMAQILGVIDQIVQHPAIQGASEIRRRLAIVEAQLKNSRTLNR